MKTIIIFIFCASSFLFMQGQESFEYIFDKNNYDWGYSVFKGTDSYFMVGGTATGTGVGNAIVSKFSDANDIETVVILKEDTVSWFFFGAEKEDGNLMAIGGVRNTIGNPVFMRTLYICEMNENLGIVSEKYYDITPEGYSSIEFYDMVIDNDGHFILAGHLDNDEGTIDNNLALVKLNMDGDLIDFNYFEDVHYNGRQQGELIVKFNGTGYYYFNGGSYEWTEFNNELEYIDGDYYLDDPHWINGAVSAKYLPNGNIAFVSVASFDEYYSDMRYSIFDSGLQSIWDTIVVEEGRQSPAIFKGMDYTDPENIWILNFNDWNTPTQIENYEIMVFDSGLNLKASKFYVGTTEYSFYYLIATQDGGCLLTGFTKQVQGSMYRDFIIKKIALEDVLTDTKENTFSDLKDVLVWPNPVTDFIYLKTQRQGLVFRLYGTGGQVFYETAIGNYGKNEINISQLPGGCYVYSIVNPDGMAIDGGKILKK